MKKLIITGLLSILSINANSSTYECVLSDGSLNDPHAVSYQFDSEKEDNKFIRLDDGSYVGCVVLRVTPNLISCGVGNDDGTGVRFSITVTADEHSSLLALDTNSLGQKSSLRCNKLSNTTI